MTSFESADQVWLAALSRLLATGCKRFEACPRCIGYAGHVTGEGPGSEEGNSGNADARGASGGDESGRESGSVEHERESARQSWRAWAVARLTGDPVLADAAAERALVALEAGESADVAAGLAALAIGLPASPFVSAVAVQRSVVATVLGELQASRARVPPEDRDAIDRLAITYTHRLDSCNKLLMAEAAQDGAARPGLAQPGLARPGFVQPGLAQATRQSAYGARPLASSVGVPGAPGVPGVPGAPGGYVPGWTASPGWVQGGDAGKSPDTGIKLLAYTGAFLLAVATILFEAYAAPHHEKLQSLAALAIVDVVFGVGAWYCRRSTRLASVSAVYLAVASVVFPLVLAATGVALHTSAMGISVAVAVAGGALVCTVFYGGLGLAIRSSAYTLMGMVAFGVAWMSSLVAAHAGIWIGPWFAPIVLVYAALSGPRGTAGLAGGTPSAAGGTAGAGTRVAPLRSLGEPLAYVSVAIALLLSLRSMPSLAFGLVVLTGELALMGVYYRRSAFVAPVATGISLSVIATTVAFHAGLRALGGDLVVLALVFAWASRSRSVERLVGALSWGQGSTTVSRGRNHPVLVFLRAGAAVQAAATLLVVAGHPWWWEAAVLTLAAVAMLWIAVANRQPAWTYLSALLVTVAWFFFARGLEAGGVPLHLQIYMVHGARSTSWLALARVYLPLGFLFGVCGLVLSRRPGSGWAWSSYAFSSWITMAVVLDAVASGHMLLAGGVLLGMAGGLEIAAVLDKAPGLAAASVLLAGGGVVSLADAGRWPLYTYPLAAGGAFVVYYLAGVLAGMRSSRSEGAPTAEQGGQGEQGEQGEVAGAPSFSGAPGMSGAPGLSSPPGSLGMSGAPGLSSPPGSLGVSRPPSRPAVAHMDHATSLRLFAMGSLAALVVVLLVDKATWAVGDRELLLAKVLLICLLAAALMVEGGMQARESRHTGKSTDWGWMSWASVVVASLAGLPLARLSGTVNPQWYVLGPGAGLLVAGLALPVVGRKDVGAQAQSANVLVGGWLAAGGYLLLAGTSALQTFEGPRLGAQALPAGVAVTLLVAEGVIAILAGIGLRRRVPVVGGALATAAGGLWALAVVARTVPLFVYFGVMGVILLAAATLLLRGRERLGAIRRSFESSWSDWT